MLKARLSRLERRLKAIPGASNDLPRSITIRVMGCRYSGPKVTLSDTGAIPIYHLCKPGGGECESCSFYDPERARNERKLPLKSP